MSYDGRRVGPLLGPERLAALVVLVTLAIADGDAAAQVVRRRFDPEDLELEKPGVVHADMAFGIMRGESAGRWLLPDFDIDVGLTPNVELGVDGAWAMEGTGDRLYAWDHAAPDNLWLSSKLGLLDVRDAARTTAWAAGVQVGPRVALAPGARGAGFEALALFGRTVRTTHVVVNVGGLVEPGGQVTSDRPVAALAGLDASTDLDDGGTFSILADFSSVTFVTPEKDQLSTTVGLQWGALSWLDVSASGLVGFLSGGDRYGAYLNISPKIRLF